MFSSSSALSTWYFFVFFVPTLLSALAVIVAATMNWGRYPRAARLMLLAGILLILPVGVSIAQNILINQLVPGRLTVPTVMSIVNLITSLSRCSGVIVLMLAAVVDRRGSNDAGFSILPTGLAATPPPMASRHQPLNVHL